jgi:hypothetical protein
MGVCAVAGALLTACTTPLQQYTLRNLSLSCDEANRATYRTLDAMGFAVTDFKPATAAAAGVAKGNRETGEPGLTTERVTVRINCSSGATTIDAREDGKVLGQVDFKRAFFLSFTAGQAMEERRREMEERIAQGAVEPSRERRGLQVLVEPVRGQAAKLDFEIDLAAAAVLPIRIRVVNPTDRRYTMSPDDVQLTRADRTRAAPLPTREAVTRVAAAKDPGTGAPVTDLSTDALSERLGRLRFTATRIEPRSEAKGYLYYPLAEYRRARVVLTEVESDEAEGFVIEF